MQWCFLCYFANEPPTLHQAGTSNYILLRAMFIWNTMVKHLSLFLENVTKLNLFEKKLHNRCHDSTLNFSLRTKRPLLTTEYELFFSFCDVWHAKFNTWIEISGNDLELHMDIWTEGPEGAKAWAALCS